MAHKAACLREFKRSVSRLFERATRCALEENPSHLSVSRTKGFASKRQRASMEISSGNGVSPDDVDRKRLEARGAVRGGSRGHPDSKGDPDSSCSGSSSRLAPGANLKALSSNGKHMGNEEDQRPVSLHHASPSLGEDESALLARVLAFTEIGMRVATHLRDGVIQNQNGGSGLGGDASAELFLDSQALYIHTQWWYLFRSLGVGFDAESMRFQGIRAIRDALLSRRGNGSGGCRRGSGLCGNGSGGDNGGTTKHHKRERGSSAIPPSLLISLREVLAKLVDVRSRWRPRTMQLRYSGGGGKRGNGEMRKDMATTRQRDLSSLSSDTTFASSSARLSRRGGCDSLVPLLPLALAFASDYGLGPHAANAMLLRALLLVPRHLLRQQRSSVGSTGARQHACMESELRSVAEPCVQHLVSRIVAPALRPGMYRVFCWFSSSPFFPFSFFSIALSFLSIFLFSIALSFLSIFLFSLLSLLFLFSPFSEIIFLVATLHLSALLSHTRTSSPPPYQILPATDRTLWTS